MGDGSLVSASFVATASYEERSDGYFHPTAQYRIRLAFLEAVEIAIVESGQYGVVSELELTAVDPEQHDGRGVHVTVLADPGVGTDVDLYCREVVVVAVDGPLPLGDDAVAASAG